MAGRLENRTALVTGGSRGIGAAIATAFAAEGADVAFCHDDDPEGAAAVTAAIQGYSRRALAVQCDVADDAAVERFWAAAEGALGNRHRSTTPALAAKGPFKRSTYVRPHDRRKFARAVPFRETRVPGMRRGGADRQHRLAVAYKGRPVSHYCAAKAGAVGLTRALA